MVNKEFGGNGGVADNIYRPKAIDFPVVTSLNQLDVAAVSTKSGQNLFGTTGTEWMTDWLTDWLTEHVFHSLEKRLGEIGKLLLINHHWTTISLVFVLLLDWP